MICFYFRLLQCIVVRLCFREIGCVHFITAADPSVLLSAGATQCALLSVPSGDCRRDISSSWELHGAQRECLSREDEKRRSSRAEITPDCLQSRPELHYSVLTSEQSPLAG